MVLVATAEGTSGSTTDTDRVKAHWSQGVDEEFECRLVCASVATQAQGSALLLVEYPLVIPGHLTEAAVVP
jgi:hypothetical protein